MTETKKLKSNSAQAILKSALKKGVEVEVISPRFNLFRLTWNGRCLFVKGTSFPVNPQPSCMIANNKFLTKKVLKPHKILMPKSWLVKTASEAYKIATSKEIFPCVLKPVKGAHGKRVFAKIESLDEFEEILPLSFGNPGKRDILVEEFIEGKDYRFLVVDNQVSAVMERIPAHVIGDGKSSIRQLIKKFNQNPLVGKRYEKPMCRIRVDGEVRRILKKQEKKLSSIPKEGERVFLRQNANISTGGIGKDVTNKVSQELKDIAIKAAKIIGLKITGVDIIYNPKENKGYLLELNDCPGIDIHHFPVSGKPQNVASDIIDFLFNEQLRGGD